MTIDMNKSDKRSGIPVWRYFAGSFFTLLPACLVATIAIKLFSPSSASIDIVSAVGAGPVAYSVTYNNTGKRSFMREIIHSPKTNVSAVIRTYAETEGEFEKTIYRLYDVSGNKSVLIRTSGKDEKFITKRMKEMVDSKKVAEFVPDSWVKLDDVSRRIKNKP